MDREMVSKLMKRFEQLEYLLKTVFRNIEEGDSQSAQTGICLALELLEKIKEDLRLQNT